jgi:hypothetical protein
VAVRIVTGLGTGPSLPERFIHGLARGDTLEKPFLIPERPSTDEPIETVADLGYR